MAGLTKQVRVDELKEQALGISHRISWPGMLQGSINGCYFLCR
jgi:hypothetical protein